MRRLSLALLGFGLGLLSATGAIAQAVQQQKLRPEVPAECPPDFAALLGECWHDESGRRPSFTKVLGRLQAQVALGTWREIT